MRYLIGAVVTLVILALAGAIFVYSGTYNVAASDPHTTLMWNLMESVMERSVERRARDVQVPDLSNREMIRAGFQSYDVMCVQCHAAPGVERSEIGKGLNPPAPALHEEALEWSPAELFWITRHGIKMTGMPAWGDTHTEQQLWEVVAFVRQLPSISAEQYDRLRSEAAAARGGRGGAPADDHHGHTH